MNIYLLPFCVLFIYLICIIQCKKLELLYNNCAVLFRVTIKNDRILEFKPKGSLLTPVVIIRNFQAHNLRYMVLKTSH